MQGTEHWRGGGTGELVPGSNGGGRSTGGGRRVGGRWDIQKGWEPGEMGKFRNIGTIFRNRKITRRWEPLRKGAGTGNRE